MTDALIKLQRDLTIAEQMAEGMADYLRMDTLFGKMPGTMPALTLGGYLLRQHRLLALRDVLSLAEQERLSRTVQLVYDTLQAWVVRSEARAHQEFGARLRQWEEYIRDLRRDLRGTTSYFPTSVETRAMITGLHNLLTTPPFNFDETLMERLSLLDSGLQAIWAPGPFVWPEEWAPAYPSSTFWYLYGKPRLITTES